ncbi:MAG: hypothetical protein R2764_22975 [Bacteroidales bacterium]
MILRILKYLLKTILIIIFLLLLLISVKYISCPVYDFPAARAFSGDTIFNPYESMDSLSWKKANFQVQSYAWSGLTSGRGNTNEAIYKVYKSLGYDIIATSDYQKINKFREGDSSYIPVYEHGYGIFKNHQVLLGANKVLWKDYPFFQTIHNKQHILQLLKKSNELVYIAHPKLRNGYSVEDMKVLSLYDGIEVLNNYRTSLEHWDAALSSGIYVTLLGNDDAHDISNPNEIGHHCTFINSPTVNRGDIMASLKLGNSFGAKIYRPDGESFEEKINRTKILPVIKDVSIVQDTIFVRIDSTAWEIRFIGQEGKLSKAITNSNKALCFFSNSDTYIRIEIEFYDRTIYYLNPISRSSGSLPNARINPEINLYKTWVLRIVGSSTIIFIVVNIFYFRKRHKSKLAGS